MTPLLLSTSKVCSHRVTTMGTQGSVQQGDICMKLGAWSFMDAFFRNRMWGQEFWFANPLVQELLSGSGIIFFNLFRIPHMPPAGSLKVLPSASGRDPTLVSNQNLLSYPYLWTAATCEKVCFFGGGDQPPASSPKSQIHQQSPPPINGM